MAADDEKQKILPGISRTIALLFGSELFLFVVTLYAGVSLGVRGKPNISVMALAGIFFLGALTSFVVVVGRGLLSGVKRLICLALVLVALVTAFMALSEMTSLGEAFTEKNLLLDREIRDIEFNLKYHDGSPLDEEYRNNEALLREMGAAKEKIRKGRALSLRATAVVVGGAFFLLLMNLVLLVEVTKLHNARRAEKRGALRKLQ